MGESNASHAEYDPEAPNAWIVPVSCAVPNRADGAPNLSGGLRITVEPNSLAGRILHHSEIDEDFLCNYELNPVHQAAVEAGGLRITGVGEQGEARIVELPNHHYFLATLFLPQHNSTPDRPHPLVTAFVEAAMAFRVVRAGAVAQNEHTSSRIVVMTEANHEKAVHAAFRAAEREDAFWEKHYKRLLWQYPDQWIAVRDGEVIATSSDLSGIVKELEQLGLKPTQAWVQYLDAHPMPMIL